MSSDEDRAWEQTVAWHARIAEYVDRLQQVAQSDPGFTGVAFDEARRGLLLYGVGPVPPAVAQAMREAPTEITPQWISVPYSEAEIQAAGRRAIESLAHVTSFGPDQNFAGLELKFDDSVITDAEILRLQADAQEILGIRVTATLGSGAVPI